MPECTVRHTVNVEKQYELHYFTVYSTHGVFILTNSQKILMKDRIARGAAIED